MLISCEQSALLFISTVICCGSSVHIHQRCFPRNSHDNHNTENDTNDLKDHYDYESSSDTDSISDSVSDYDINENHIMNRN